MFAIDTNIVLDVVVDIRGTGVQSSTLLEESSRYGALVACGVVWAELAALNGASEVDRILAVLRIVVDWEMGRSVLLHASTAWGVYLKRRRERGRSFVCPHCHTGAGEWPCPNCGEPLPPPRHILTDFLIGAHAQARGLSLITRDRGIYQRYFPDLALIQP